MKIPFLFLTNPTSEYCEVVICNLKKLIDSVKQIDDAKYNTETKRWMFPKIHAKTFEKNIQMFAHRVNYDIIPISKDVPMVDENKENQDPQKFVIQIRHDKETINVKVNPYNQGIIDFLKSHKNRRYNPETKEWIMDNEAEMLIKNFFQSFHNIEIKDI